MTLALSLFACLFALYLLLDAFFLGGAVFLSLPAFSASASALVGVLIAGMEYKSRKGKKKRRAPMACILLGALTGILATALWLYRLLAP